MVLGEHLPESPNSPHSGGPLSWITSLRNTIGGILGKKDGKETVEQPKTITRTVDGFHVTLKQAQFRNSFPGLSDDQVATFIVEKVQRETPNGLEEVSPFAAFSKAILVLPRDILSKSAETQTWSSDPIDIVLRSTAQGAASMEIAQMIAGLEDEQGRPLTPRGYPAGTDLITENTYLSDALALMSGTVEILVEGPQGQQIHIRTVDSPTVLGERSALQDEPTSATVRAMTDCTVITIPKERLKSLAQEDRWKERFEELIEERLINTTLTLREYEESQERERVEREATGFPLEDSLAAALDLPSAAEEIDRRVRDGEYDAVVRRPLKITGVHRETKERQEITFYIAMCRMRNGDIGVHISLDKNAAPGDTLMGPGIVCNVADDLANAVIDEAYFHELKGYGFYSRMLPTLLRYVAVSESRIANLATRKFLATQKKGAIVPSTLLAAHSPVVGAHKHGLTVMRGTFGDPAPETMPGHTEPLKTYKVGANWQVILILGTELERILTLDDVAYAERREALAKKYHEYPARIAQMVLRHTEDEADSLLSLYESEDYQKAAEIQLARLMELSKRIGQRESKLLKQQKEML